MVLSISLYHHQQPSPDYLQLSLWTATTISSLIQSYLHILFYPIINISVAAAKSLQSCPSVRPHRRQPTRLPCSWDSPGKNTGVGCHFLLQCMKVESESEVAQSRPTLSNPMDCSLPGSSIHGIFQTRVLEWSAIAFSNISVRVALLKHTSIQVIPPPPLPLFKIF